MTIDDIVSRVQTQGKVMRTDVLDALEVYQDKDLEQENLSLFLDTVGTVSEEDKAKILADINSYPVSYPR